MMRWMSEKTNHPTHGKPIIIASGMLSHSFKGLDSHCLQALSKTILIIKVTAIVKLWNFNWAEKVFKLSYYPVLQQLQTVHNLFQVGGTISQYSDKLAAVTGLFSKV